MNIVDTLTAMGAVAVLVRQAVEFIKAIVPYSTAPALVKYVPWLLFQGKPFQWQQLIDVLLVSGSSMLLCYLKGVDLVNAMNIPVPAWAGIVLTGFACAMPASLLNEFITWVEAAASKTVMSLSK